MINVGIYGASGRVGKILCELLKEHALFSLAGTYAKTKKPHDSVYCSTANASALLDVSDVIIDFSSPEGTAELLEAAEDKPTAIVIGTTGLDERQKHLITDCAKKMPILYATNMSLGVALLNSLVKTAAEKLNGFDIEIVEMHHRHKKDAPSGTALTLAASAAKARGLDLDTVRVSGRNGIIGERSTDEIAVMSLRGGDIVGEHTVGFYHDGEFLRLSHTATSRETFAQGALRAAQWLVTQKPGLYKIQDCLGV